MYPQQAFGYTTAYRPADTGTGIIGEIMPMMVMMIVMVMMMNMMKGVMTQTAD